MRKRALIVTHNGRFIAQFLLDDIKVLQNLGYEVHCASDFENEEMVVDAKERIEQAGCILHQFDIKRMQWKPDVLFSNAKAYGQLKRIVDGGFDLVHCHTPMGGMLARLASIKARKKGTKVFYTAHGFHFFKGAPLINWLLYFPVEWALARFTDALITINKEDYARAQKFAAKSVFYVPGVGIETSRFAPNPEAGEQLRGELGIRDDEFVLLSVGEVNANKNHQVVVRALPHLKQCKYVICGVGPLGEELKSLATELGVEKQLVLAGYRSDISRFYQMADCFVFPSLREGLSVALMEAMGAETPIACTAIRGNTDLIEDRVTGYIVKNDPADVARTLQHIIEHKDERHNCAVAAREKLRQFDLERVVENVRKIYLTTLEK